MFVGSGDDARGFGPPWVGNESAYFLSVNRNKKVTITIVLLFFLLEVLLETFLDQPWLQYRPIGKRLC